MLQAILCRLKTGQVFIDGVAQDPPSKSVMPYVVETNGQLLDAELMKEEYDVDISNPDQLQFGGNNYYQMWLPSASAKN